MKHSEPIILAIDTSADDTSAAVVQGRRVLSHVEYSQIALHAQWGGIYPTVAKRAHEEHIDEVVARAMKKSGMPNEAIDGVAVTYGPGLAIALEVGMGKAQEMANTLGRPLIPINHMEGHLYSSFLQNRKGNPPRPFAFPYLGLLVSGGHTELVLFTDHLTYKIVGETLDDAAGESLDKAARMLGFGYPGGAVIERLAEEVHNSEFHRFPRPMWKTDSLDFSFSGLKTSLLYYLKSLSEEQKIATLSQIASSYQEAVYASLLQKTEAAIQKYNVCNLVLGGGVAVNRRLRFLLRALVLQYGGLVFFPPYKYLNFDNAAMIGIVGSMRFQRGIVQKNDAPLIRNPRLSLVDSSL